MPLQSLGDSLGSWSSKREFHRRLAAATIINAANELADGRFRAVSFTQGVLNLAIPNGSVRYRLTPELPSLIAAINAKLGRSVVERIKFRLASTDPD